MAQWITTGDPGADITGINVDRFHPYQCNPEYRKTRVVETLGMVYRRHYPTRVPQTARDCKRSPFHDRLQDQRAYFTDVSGWESPAWFAPEGREPKVEKLSWGRQNWFPYWESEHRACREGVIAMDMTFMGKFLVQGRDAGRVLDHISANSVNGPVETITYTQWLNERGMLEADVTVTKLAEDHFIVVVTDTMHRHVETWLRRHIPSDAHCFVTDITGGIGQLNVQGPKSRELLQSITSADLSNEAFPFRTAREIDIGFARVQCNRITYVGELGYELNIPAEQAVYVYDRVVEAGANFGLRHAGLRALGSLRMEKGYRDYGHDIDNTDDAYETGLGFVVDLSKPDFIGKAYCVEKKAQGPAYNRRLLQVLVSDPEPLLYHAEVVYRNNKAVGYIRAASYGHTLGGAVGLAMIEAGEPINKAYLQEGEWQIDIAGTRYPARGFAATHVRPEDGAHQGLGLTHRRGLASPRPRVSLERLFPRRCYDLKEALVSYLTYKILHLVAILFLFTSLGSLAVLGQSADARLRKLASIVHGVSAAVILVAGFGLLARLGFFGKIPTWAWLKVGLWILLAASAWPLRRRPEWTPVLWLMLPALGGVAAWLAVAKPF